MPNLVNSYNSFLTTTWSNTVPMTVTFTPAAGEILVIKVITSDASTAAASTPTVTGGGSPTATIRASSVHGGQCAGYIWTATTTAATSATVNCLKTNAGGTAAAMYVERWSSAALAATPNTGSIEGSTTTGPTVSFTTAATSAVSWADGDWAASTGTTTYIGTTGTVTPETDTQNNPAGSYSAYFATQTCSGTSSTIGMTAPATQTYTLVGIEILQGTVTYTPVFTQKFGTQQSVKRASLW